MGARAPVGIRKRRELRLALGIALQTKLKHCLELTEHLAAPNDDVLRDGTCEQPPAFFSRAERSEQVEQVRVHARAESARSENLRETGNQVPRPVALGLRVAPAELDCGEN